MSATTETIEPVAPGSLDEILAPLREGFQQSGLSEADLDVLFEEAREEAWQQNQARATAGLGSKR